MRTILSNAVAMLLLLAAFSAPTFAQVSKSLGGKGLSDATGLNSFGTGGFGGLASLKSPATFSAKYEAEQSGDRGRLMVTAEIEKNHYIFSTTQPKGGPIATVIEIDAKGIALAGPFVPDRSPEVVLDMAGFEGIKVEKFYDSVTWTAPVTFEKQVKDDSQSFDITINGQVCRTGACIPIDGSKASASFAGFYTTSVASDAPFRDPIGHVGWTVRLSEQVVAPGKSVQLLVTGTPDKDYHLFPIAVGEEDVKQKTLITVTQSGTLDVGVPKTESGVTTESLAGGALTVTYHKGAVTWTVPIQVASDKAEGVYPISGLVGYQACTDESCDQPLAFQFSGEIHVGAGAVKDNKPVALSTSNADFSLAANAYQKSRDQLIAQATVAEPKQAMAIADLFRYFAMAMVGGFILNFMPCVLPVIGLKVMSFINESKGNSGRIAMLNLWYTAGILSVFLGFAIGTIVIQLLTAQTIGWGQQFQSFGVQLTIIILLTAMALSFLGVWEIPVPGFANSGKAVEMSTRQGAIGAYSKGLIATFIAIPCSGPMLGQVFALTLTQPAWVIMVMFLGMGLGMALPYIVFAAFPQAMKFLPQPGEWMITFKQLLAFPLLLAVVWFVSTVEPDYRIAALTIAVMTGMGCWIIGKVPAYAEFDLKARAWIMATLVVVISGIVSVKYLGPRDLIDWLPYDESQLQAMVADGTPVMIDFTASWCSTCQVNSLVAIETKKVAEALEKNGMVPMLADLSKPNPAITRKIQQLQSNSIPLLAIYPAGENSEPIVLRDLVSQQMVLDAIDQAISSRKGAQVASAPAVQEAEPAATAVSLPPKAVKKSVSDKSSVIAKPEIQ